MSEFVVTNRSGELQIAQHLRPRSNNGQITQSSTLRHASLHYDSSHPQRKSRSHIFAHTASNKSLTESMSPGTTLLDTWYCLPTACMSEEMVSAERTSNRSQCQPLGMRGALSTLALTGGEQSKSPCSLTRRQTLCSGFQKETLSSPYSCIRVSVWCRADPPHAIGLNMPSSPGSSQRLATTPKRAGWCDDAPE